MPYRDLQDILNITVGWERDLKDLYDVAEVAFREEKSKKVVALLRDKLVKNLQVLEGVDVEKYGKTEWVRYSLDIRTDDLIPRTKFKKDSTPKEIFERILEAEEKMKDFYSTIRDLLVSRKQQELFDSLVTFKVGQIIDIKNYMESYDSFI